MTFPEYADHDGVGLAGLVAKGQVSAAELVEAAIGRIERHNGTLNAIVLKAYDEARAAARGALPDGPFRGVPMLIKDLGASVAGWRKTRGSRFTGERADEADSLLVGRYRAAGMVLLGKTNTPEFGITGTTESARLGPCRNPWNPRHIAGGSSGGAAAAVASGMVPIAHASDGLGSIRIPAACCGLVGLKVTRDRNPDPPDDDDLVSGLVVNHVVTRTVRDSAAMLDWTGRDTGDSPYAPPAKTGPYLDEVGRSPGRLRIGWTAATPGGRDIHPRVRASLEETIALLEGLGHEVTARDLPIDQREIYRALAPVTGATFAAQMRRLIDTIGREPEPDELEPLTWASLVGGRRVNGEQAFLGLQAMRRLSRAILAMFETIDVLLSPVMGTPPPPIGHIDPVRLEPKEVNRRQAEAFPFTPPFNVTGQPSLSLPLAWSDEGLPIGMMFTGRYADEATLIRLAAQLETAAPWRDRRPPVWG